MRGSAAFAGALAFIAGFADSDAYVRWHQFAANMTGNTVLFGIETFAANLHGALLSIAPIVAFIAGCAVAQSLGVSLRGVALLVEAACLAAASFAEPHRWQLAVVAFAMGVQNTTISRFGNVRANTSFVTGNYGRIATASTKLITGQGGDDERETLIVLVPLVLAYAFGAACDAALIGRYVAHTLLFLVPIVLVAAYAIGRRPPRSTK